MVDYTDSEVGWVPDPDNNSTCIVPSLDLPGETYEFTRYRISHGRANKWSHEIAVEVNAASELVPGIGNYPLNVLATPIGGDGDGHGYARITWNYDPTDQPAIPDGFNVYTQSSFRHYINGVHLGNDEFLHTAADVTGDFYTGQTILVSDSTGGNDGEHEVSEASYSAPTSAIKVKDDLIGGGAGGYMKDTYGMTTDGDMVSYITGRRRYSYTTGLMPTGAHVFEVRTTKDGSELTGVSDSCVINDTADPTTGTSGMACKPIVAGQANITWNWDPTNPPSVPNRFITYHRSDAGDAWAADLDSDAYNSSRRRYLHESSELSDKTWFFRVVSAAGGAIDSDIGSCVIDGTGPAAMSDITLTLPEWT